MYNIVNICLNWFTKTTYDIFSVTGLLCEPTHTSSTLTSSMVYLTLFTVKFKDACREIRER